MYAVSDKYKAAMKQPVQRFRMTGKIGSVDFDDDNILSGSFSITNQCSDGSNVQIGQVYIGELDSTFMNVSLGRYDWKEKQIVPSFGLLLPDGNYEDIPLGNFTIDSAKYTASGVVIKAYDNMAKLDKTCSLSQINGTVFDLMTTACSACGLTLGSTQEELDALPNGGIELSLYNENDIETWRDFVSWVAITCGCNAFAGRDGKIYLRAYSQNIVDELDTAHRFSGCEFSAFETRYTGVSCVNIGDKTTSYYGLDVDDGLTYNIGQDPFLQYGIDEKVEEHRRAVLTALQQIDYVPFKASLIGNPAYDLMDVFRFTDGLADKTKLFCMTKYTFKYNSSYEMEGVGQDPSLASARSKVDKNLSGIISSYSDQEYIRYYDYQNGAAYDIAEDVETEIIHIRYVTVKQTHIDFHAEILMKVSTKEEETDASFTDHDAVITVTYYLNDQEIKDYHPEEMLADGRHMLHLLLTWDSTANQIGVFTVRINISGGSAAIDRGAARAYMAGQGLAGNGAWDGTIEVSDEMSSPSLTSVLQPIEGAVSVTTLTPETGGAADIVPAFSLFSVLGSISGTVGKLQFLHRFDTLHDSLMTYDKEKLEIKDGVWKLKDGVTLAEIVTPDEPADKILWISSNCDSNNVNFLASFDHGATWWEYQNGRSEPDTTKESYGMFGPAMKMITESQWAEKLAGAIMMKAIIHEKGTLTDIQIFVREENS